MNSQPMAVKIPWTNELVNGRGKSALPYSQDKILTRNRAKVSDSYLKIEVDDGPQKKDRYSKSKFNSL